MIIIIDDNNNTSPLIYHFSNQWPLKVLYNCLTFTRSCTHSRTDGGVHRARQLVRNGIG